MKKFSLIILLVSQLGFAGLGKDAALMQSFNTLLDQEMLASDGEVLSLYCGPSADVKGITCAARIKLTDTVSNSSSEGGSEEICDEVYNYDGKVLFYTACSTCEYSKSYGFHQNSCTLEFLKINTPTPEQVEI